jgi:hypothetical protein
MLSKEELLNRHKNAIEKIKKACEEQLKREGMMTAPQSDIDKGLDVKDEDVVGGVEED